MSQSGSLHFTEAGIEAVLQLTHGRDDFRTYTLDLIDEQYGEQEADQAVPLHRVHDKLRDTAFERGGKEAAARITAGYLVAYHVLRSAAPDGLELVEDGDVNLYEARVHAGPRLLDSDFRADYAAHLLVGRFVDYTLTNALTRGGAKLMFEFHRRQVNPGCTPLEVPTPDRSDTVPALSRAQQRWVASITGM